MGEKKAGERETDRKWTDKSKIDEKKVDKKKIDKKKMDTGTHARLLRHITVPSSVKRREGITYYQKHPETSRSQKHHGPKNIMVAETSQSLPPRRGRLVIRTIKDSQTHDSFCLRHKSG